MVTIVRAKESIPFDPSKPLEVQARGAKQVVINYSPTDSNVTRFMEEFERIARSGVGFQVSIKFNSNHSLEGYRAERQVEKIMNDLEINELTKKLVKFHHTAEKQLMEMQDMCMGSNNE